MWFGILGPLHVRLVDGTSVAVDGARRRALLSLLALDAGRFVSMERLVDGIYGENPPAGARNAVQAQVSRLRLALGEGAPVEFDAVGYRLAVEPEDVDVHQFYRLRRDGRAALEAGDHAGAAALLREGLELWRGPALGDLSDQAVIAGLAEDRVAATEDRIDAELALGGHRALVAELRQLVADHPFRERLRGQLMRALHADGRQAEALEVFAETRRVLADEFGAEPSAALAAVHLAVLRVVPERRTGGLPGQLTTFVGRDEELGALRKLLGEHRLVTLTGPGGAGKTRVAVAAGERWDGDACFVDLAAVSEETQVPQAFVVALGLGDTLSRSADPLSRIEAALDGRSVLVVLDNCEHVVDAAARVAERLLVRCSGLRVLATSREALGITGEVLYPLPPLTVPFAVRLFSDRAAAVSPGFAAERSAIERICQGLDGMPLAIELAAARLRSLSIQDIMSRLDDRFTLLSKGSRTAPPRHRTLHAVVSWSWELLEPDEQALARWLTVFVGGATLADVSRVCGLSDAVTVDLLGSLVDKSFVEVSGGRYRMLETIRVFCAERLVESGEYERLREAHAGHFLDLAATADPHLRRAEQLDWLALLTDEDRNLHAALRWLVFSDQTARALRMVSALSMYWWMGTVNSDGAALAEELLLRVADEDKRGEDYLVCLFNVILMRAQADRVLLGSAREVLTEIGFPFRQPFATFLMGMSGIADTGDPRGSGPWSDALVHVGMGHQALRAGDLDGAGREFEAGLAGFDVLGERWGTVLALVGLSEVARGRGADAIELVDRALVSALELGAVDHTSELRVRRADCLARQGNLEEARAELAAAEELARSSGAPGSMAFVRVGVAEIALHVGDHAAARSAAAEALSLATDGVDDVRVRAEKVLASALGQ